MILQKQINTTGLKYKIFLSISTPLSIAIFMSGIFNYLLITYYFDYMKYFSHQCMVDYYENQQRYTVKNKAAIIGASIQKKINILYQLNNFNEEQINPQMQIYQIKYQKDISRADKIINKQQRIDDLDTITQKSKSQFMIYFGDSKYENDDKLINCIKQWRRILRTTYDSNSSSIDYIQIVLHNFNIEIIHPAQELQRFSQKQYSPNTQNFEHLRALDYFYKFQKYLHEDIEKDQNNKLVFHYCLYFENLISEKQIGTICIKTSNQYSKIIEEQLKFVNGQSSYLVHSQEDTKYNLIQQNNQKEFTSVFQFLFGDSSIEYNKKVFYQYFAKYFIPSKFNSGFGNGFFYFNNNTISSIAYQYVKVFIDLQESKILYSFFSYFQEQLVNTIFDQLFDVKDKIENLFALLIIITIFTLLFSFVVISLQAKTITDPLNKLTEKVRSIKEQDLDINIMNNYKEIFYEINELYQAFDQINILMKYGNDQFYRKSDAENLINYTNAILQYEELNNQKAIGIISNNLGNIHTRNGRLDEGIACYKKAVQIAEKELRQILGCDYLEVFYQIKTLTSWSNFIKNKDSPIQLDNFKQGPKKKIIEGKVHILVNLKQKKKLEEIYSNRQFNLAKALFLKGLSETGKKLKLIYFEDVINRLLIVEYLQRSLEHTKSRPIKNQIIMSQAYFERGKLTQNQQDWFEGLTCLEKAIKKFEYYEYVYNFFIKDLIQMKKEKEEYVRRSKYLSSQQNFVEEQDKNISQMSIDFIKDDEDIEQFPNQTKKSIRNKNQPNNQIEFQSLQFQSNQLFHKQCQQNLLDESEYILEVDIDDPPEIIKSNINMLQGQIFLEFGKYQEAVEHSTQGIEQGNIFDPKIRRECLNTIKQVFEQEITRRTKLIEQKKNQPFQLQQHEYICNFFKQSLKTVKQMIKDTEIKGRKDLVFILDFSESMKKNNKIYKAIDSFYEIYQIYIKEMDRLAFIQFNNNVEVVFELQTRGKNDKFLEKFIRDAKLTECKGETVLYDAIYQGVKLFEKAVIYDNSKWIVALTDGEDNQSRINQRTLKEALKQHDIKLIIIGLDLNKQVQSNLYQLCKSTNGGTFIESADSDDINITFQAITNLIFGVDQTSNFIEEYLS